MLHSFEQPVRAGQVPVAVSHLDVKSPGWPKGPWEEAFRPNTLTLNFERHQVALSYEEWTATPEERCVTVPRVGLYAIPVFFGFHSEPGHASFAPFMHAPFDVLLMWLCMRRVIDSILATHGPPSGWATRTAGAGRKVVPMRKGASLLRPANLEQAVKLLQQEVAPNGAAAEVDIDSDADSYSSAED